MICFMMYGKSLGAGNYLRFFHKDFWEVNAWLDTFLSEF